MHKKYIKFNLMKISLSMLLFLLLFVSASKSQISSSWDGNLRLITYNIWNGFTMVPDQKTTWINWLREKKPDVVALQELKEYTPEKLSNDASLWGHPFSILLKTEGFPTGITSQFPIEDVQRTLEGFHHGLLRVKIKGIYFYVIHLHPSNWKVRSHEVDLIIQDIKQLPSDAYIVIAGDFNALSISDSIFYTDENLEEFFRKRDNVYNEKNLNNSKLDFTVINKITDYGFIDTELAGRSEEFHFTGTFPTAVEKPGNHGNSRRLDYVFVTNTLIKHVTDSRIIASDNTLFFSDHLPVITDFDF